MIWPAWVQRDVQAATAGGGAALPAGARAAMEGAFAADFSAVRVHTGPASDRAAAGLGARALTAGRDIVFGAGGFRPHTPGGDRLLAHELAHVVQQAGGLPRAAVDGGAADPLEQAAEAAADQAVTSGRVTSLGPAVLAREHGGRTADRGRVLPARADALGRPVAPAGSDLFPVRPGPGRSLAYEMSHVVQRSSRGSAIQRAPVVQRQSTDPGSHTPTSAHDPHAPPSRNATAQEIVAAAYDEQAQERLDIAWIEGLPELVKTSIDESFAESVARAAFNRAVATDPALQLLDKQFATAKKTLRAEAVKRLAVADKTILHKRGADLDTALAKDPDFTAKDTALTIAHMLAVGVREAQLAEASDPPKAAAPRAETVAALPPGTKTRRLEERMFQRTNFMSWAIDVLGSAAAVKQYFRDIQKVPDPDTPHAEKARDKGLFLHKDAAERFIAARLDFENAYPGYTFPVTGGGFALRGFHRQRQNIGNLGHALGLAVDLWAYDNPNLRLSKVWGDDYDYLLTKFGRTAGQTARSHMQLEEGEPWGTANATIAQLGKATVTVPGKPMTTQGTAMVEKIRTQFNQMVATSKNFQAAIAGQLPLLSEARDLYFNAQAAKKNPATSTDPRTPEQMKAEADQKLSAAFAEWIKAIDADLDDANARKDTSDAEIAEIAQVGQDLDALPAKGPDDIGQLSAYADQYGLQTPIPAGPAPAYKAFLKKQLANKYPPRKDTDPRSPQYIRNEIAALTRWRGRLLDPAFVFGRGRVVSVGAGNTKHWATNLQEEAVPLMQLIEHGFVRQDDLSALSSSGSTPAPSRSGTKPAPASSVNKAEFFGVEVVTTLARYGFSPGATFFDTMHFDFIEGYAAVPGGYSLSNMVPKYSPTGDPASGAPEPKQKKTK